MSKAYDLFLPASDGLRLHVRMHEPVGTSRGDVICLPGLTRDWRDFDTLAKPLARARYRVASLDFRGRGLSEHDPNPMHYHIPYEAVDTLQVMASLHMKHAHFIGTSRGGMVSMYLATLRRERIQSVVLNDIGPVLEMKGLVRIASYVGNSGTHASWGDAVVALQNNNPGFTGLSVPDWVEFAKATFVERDGVVKTLYDPAISRAFLMLDPSQPFPTLWPWYDQLNGKPTLIIRGENSDLLSEATCAEMQKRNRAARCVVAVGEAHAPMLGRGSLAQLILGFIEKNGS